MFSNGHAAGRALAVTPSDTADNTYFCLYVGGAGDVAVTTEGGDVTTFKAVPVGTQLNIRTQRVMATNTTATNIVGLR